jgi:hypothetical protein
METKPLSVTSNEGNIAAIKDLIYRLEEKGLPVVLHANGSFSIKVGTPRIEAIVNTERSGFVVSGTWAGGGNNHGTIEAEMSFESLSTPEGVNEAVQLISTFLKLSTADSDSDSDPQSE